MAQATVGPSPISADQTGGSSASMQPSRWGLERWKIDWASRHTTAKENLPRFGPSLKSLVRRMFSESSLPRRNSTVREKKKPCDQGFAKSGMCRQCRSGLSSAANAAHAFRVNDVDQVANLLYTR